MPLMLADDTELPASNPPSITLGSGREVSKSTLFIVLQVGGWTALTMVCGLAAMQTLRFWPALFDTLIWTFCGILVTLAFRRIFRRWRRLHHSHVTFAAIALATSVLGAPVWFFIEQLIDHAALAALLQIESVRPAFSAYVERMAQEPLLAPRSDALSAALQSTPQVRTRRSGERGSNAEQQGCN